MYTLIHRTGVSRGRVYNGTGENLTANPVGAGNDFVGPFAQDYASLQFGTNVNYDHEFSGIILDGRALKGGGTDDSMLYPDLDEDEDLSDRGSIVGRDTNSATLSSVTVKLTHTRPRWADATVWQVPHDGSAPSDISSFDEWLDNEVGELPEFAAPFDYDHLEDDDGGRRTWARLRHYVQCPYYWALYKVKLGPNYEGLADMIAENSASPVGQTGQLSYGPLGMLTALHGTLYATQHAFRLYEPTNIVCVERGYGLMPYDSTFNDAAAGAAGAVDPDVVVGYDDGDIDLVAGTGGGTVWTGVSNFQGPAPSGYRKGGLTGWSVHSKRDVRASKDELYLWHWGTAPVRIDIVEPAGAGTASLIVGNAVSPYYGPFVHTVYHECTARFRAR